MPIYCLLYHTTRFFENLAREGNTFNIIYHKNQLYWIGKDKKKSRNKQEKERKLAIYLIVHDRIRRAADTID